MSRSNRKRQRRIEQTQTIDVEESQLHRERRKALNAAKRTRRAPKTKGPRTAPPRELSNRSKSRRYDLRMAKTGWRLPR